MNIALYVCSHVGSRACRRTRCLEHAFREPKTNGRETQAGGIAANGDRNREDLPAGQAPLGRH
jgi:hypothetical protein